MLRALFFAIKIGLFAVAAFWVAQRPGVVEIEWLDYHIKAHVGLVLLALLVFLLFALFLHRVVLGVARIPSKMKQQHDKSKHLKGYQSLTRGLTAVAAGDAAQATAMSKKTKELWPEDKALSLLLEAQAARLRGEEDIARSCFEKLVQNRDTAFLGLRGQLTNALESGKTEKALELAQEAEKVNPRQPWVVRMVYDLAIQQQDWTLAERSLTRCIKFKAVEDLDIKSEQLAINLARGDLEKQNGDIKKALKWYKAAHRLDRGFVPAAVYLASAYSEMGKGNLAKPVIKEAWKENPHPDLVPLWDKLAPDSKDDGGNARLRWFEKLVALRPDCAEGQLAAARIALDYELWGEARQYLHMAEEIKPTARLYRMYATLSEKLGNSEEANEYFEKAIDAEADKVWTCIRSGRIYESWSPIAHPHGSFNTIRWDYPQAQHLLKVGTSLPQNELLITAK